MVFEKLIKCPSCHERLHTEEIKREPLDSDTIQVKDPMLILPINLEKYIFPEDNNTHAVHIQTYNVTYRCKNCGHEWSDLAQENNSDV